MVARAIKRIADPILAFFLLLLLSPALLAIAIWILVDTGRPVLYAQTRAEYHAVTQGSVDKVVNSPS